MKLIPVRGLPERAPKADYKFSSNWYKEFMEMNVKYAKVVINDFDYVNVHSAYASFRTSVRKYNYPIDVRLMGADIYFIRTDMEESECSSDQ